MSDQGFAARIFLLDGNADGVRFVAKAKWPGRCIVIPREHLADVVGHDNLRDPGLCLFIGAGENERPALSIEVGEPLKTVIAQEKRGWDRVYCFASKDLSFTLDQFRYLAARLDAVARTAHSVDLSTAPPPTPLLSNAARKQADAYLADLLSLCPLLDLHAFEPAPTATPKQRRALCRLRPHPHQVRKQMVKKHMGRRVEIVVILVLLLIASAHLLRLATGAELRVNTTVIPLWVSLLGFLGPTALAGLFWWSHRS